MKFNINNNVKVKLTDYGRELHKKDWESFWLHSRGIPASSAPPYAAPKEDEEGYSTWQMWGLMQLFGEHIGVGFNLIPFETEIVLITE